MQLPVLIDVIFGVFFVYLVLSLVTSAVNEAIAAMLSSRAKWLYKGVLGLFGESEKSNPYASAFYQSPFVSYLNEKTSVLHRGVSYLPAQAAYRALLTHVVTTPKNGQSLYDAVCMLLAHYPNSAAGISQAISTLPKGKLREVLERLDVDAGADADRFSVDLRSAIERLNDEAERNEAKDTLSTILKGLVAQVPENWSVLKQRVSELPQGSPIRAILEDILRSADGKLDLVEQRFEAWYKSFEVQVGAWYRQKTHMVLAGISLFIVISMNVDTFALMKQLSTDNKLRDTIVAQALTHVGTDGGLPEERARTQAYDAYSAAKESNDKNPSAADTANSSQEIDALHKEYLGKQKIYEETLLARVRGLETAGLQFGWSTEYWRDLFRLDSFSMLFALLHKLSGLLLTAAALTLGAPFWFDMLQKVAQIRSVGRSPFEREKLGEK